MRFILKFRLGFTMFFTLNLCLLNTSISQSSFHIVGTSNLQNTNSTFPSIYGNWFRGVKHQILIKASELQAS